MAVNKVVYNTESGPETLIDLTGDTVTSETLAEGVTAHDASGKAIIGMASTEHTHTSIKESNHGKELAFWIGTQAEYNALAEPPQDTYVIISDDNTLETIMAEIETLKANSSGNASATEYGYYTPEPTSGGDVIPSSNTSKIGYFYKIGKLVHFWVDIYNLYIEPAKKSEDAGVTLPVEFTGVPTIIVATATVGECIRDSGLPLTVQPLNNAIINVGGASADLRDENGNAVSWNFGATGNIRISGTYLVE